MSLLRVETNNLLRLTNQVQETEKRFEYSKRFFCFLLIIILYFFVNIVPFYHSVKSRTIQTQKVCGGLLISFCPF